MAKIFDIIKDCGAVPEWLGRGLQNLYAWVRFPPAPPTVRNTDFFPTISNPQPVSNQFQWQCVLWPVRPVWKDVWELSMKKCTEVNPPSPECSAMKLLCHPREL